MKKIIFYVGAFLFAGCSTLAPKTEELQQAPVCQVWKEGPLGSKTVATLEGEVAKQKQTCWLMNLFMCTYNEYSYKNGGADIVVNGETIARLEGGQRVTAISLPGIAVGPIELNGNVIKYDLQGPVGPKQSMIIEYNKSCTKRQAALGLMSMIAK